VLECDPVPAADGVTITVTLYSGETWLIGRMPGSDEDTRQVFLTVTAALL
jgi:hypothetical protein